MSIEQNETQSKWERPWSKEKFRDGKIYEIPIDYIFEHINANQKERLVPNADDWTISKEFAIDNLLDSGIQPEDVFPIRLSVFRYSEVLTVTDGITRLRVFRRRGIKEIKAKLYHAS